MRIEVTDVSLVSTWAWDIPKDLSKGKHGVADQTVHMEKWEDIQNEDEDAENDEEEYEVCGICRNRYDATCPSCDYPGSGCPIVLGLCNHNFHVHCIKPVSYTHLDVYKRQVLAAKNLFLKLKKKKHQHNFCYIKANDKKQ